MTNTEKGTFYEKGIEFLIRQNPKLYFDNTKIEWNAKIKGNSGVEHQIDILLTTGEELTLIECKNHKRTIGYDVVAKMDSILNDINNSKGIIYSMSGFSSGAEKYAVSKPIKLISMNEKEIIFQGCIYALKKCLPNLDDPVQKYFVIMEQLGNSTTGKYQLQNFGNFGYAFVIYESISDAKKYCDNGYNIFPLSSEHLRILNSFAKIKNKMLLICTNGNLYPFVGL